MGGKVLKVHGGWKVHGGSWDRRDRKVLMGGKVLRVRGGGQHHGVRGDRWESKGLMGERHHGGWKVHGDGKVRDRDRGHRRMAGPIRQQQRWLQRR